MRKTGGKAAAAESVYGCSDEPRRRGPVPAANETLAAMAITQASLSSADCAEKN